METSSKAVALPPVESSKGTRAKSHLQQAMGNYCLVLESSSKTNLHLPPLSEFASPTGENGVAGVTESGNMDGTMSLPLGDTFRTGSSFNLRLPSQPATEGRFDLAFREKKGEREAEEEEKKEEEFNSYTYDAYSPLGRSGSPSAWRNGYFFGSVEECCGVDGTRPPSGLLRYLKGDSLDGGTGGECEAAKREEQKISSHEMADFHQNEYLMPDAIGTVDGSPHSPEVLSNFSPIFQQLLRRNNESDSTENVGACHSANRDGKVINSSGSSSHTPMEDHGFGKVERIDELADLYAADRDVALLLLYPGDVIDAVKRGNHPEEMWPCMEEFFLTVFHKLSSTATCNEADTFSVQISLTVLKHDQMKELLPKGGDGAMRPRCFTKALIEKSPLHGPVPLHAIYYEVKCLEDVRKLVRRALRGMTTDDYRCGVLLFLAILRQFKKETDDILVSTMVSVVSTVETIYVAVKNRQPSTAASLFRMVFRNPRLAASLVRALTVSGLQLSSAETSLMIEVNRVLQARSIRRRGDITVSLRSVLGSAMAFCRALMDQEGKEKNDKDDGVNKTDGASPSLPPTRALECLQKIAMNIRSALRTPISEFHGILPNKEKFFSEGNGGAEVPERQGKQVTIFLEKIGKRASKLLKIVATRWTQKRIGINLFGGVLAAPTGGIKPLFTEATLIDGEFLHERLCSLLFLELLEDAGEKEIINFVEPNSVEVNTTEGLLCKLSFNEICLWRNKPFACGPSTQGASISYLLSHAFSLFGEGYNTAILYMRDGAKCFADILTSPLWLTLLRFVESETAARSTGRELYLSVTQVLSMDCVRDHLATESVGEFQDFIPLSFQAAWTPAGPVVRGAKFVSLNSVDQFVEILSLLSMNAKVLPISLLSGMNLIFSFILKRGKSAEITVREDPAALDEDVVLSSMTFTLTTGAECYKSLWIDEFVPMESPRNLYRCIQQHFTLCVTDVNNVCMTALNFFETQKLLQQIKVPPPQRKWTMRSLEKYLAERCAMYMQEILWLKGKSNVSLTREQQDLIFGDTQTATLRDIAEAWALVERMRSAVKELLDAPNAAHPMAIVADGSYDITMPPNFLLHSSFASTELLIDNQHLQHHHHHRDVARSLGGERHVEPCGRSPSVKAGNGMEQNGLDKNNYYSILGEPSKEQQQLYVQGKLGAVKNTQMRRGNEETNHFRSYELGLSQESSRFFLLPAISSIFSPEFDNKRNEVIHRWCEFLPRGVPNETTFQKSVSRRLDEILERACEVFDGQVEKKGKKLRIQPAAVVLHDNANSSGKLHVEKKCISLQKEECFFTSLDRTSNAVTSLEDLPGVSGLLMDLTSRFQKGQNVTLLTADATIGKHHLALTMLLDFVRLALKRKPNETYITFSFVFVRNGRFVYDLLADQETLMASKLSFKCNRLLGPMIQDGVRWHDVQHAHEVDAIIKQIEQTLSVLLVRCVSKEDMQSTFIMLTAVAKTVEPHDVVFSSFVGFFVWNEVNLYDFLLRSQEQEKQVNNAEKEAMRSILLSAVRDRSSFVRTCFVYHTAMPETCAQRFLMVQNRLCGCFSNEPHKGSLASMTRRQKAKVTGKTTGWKRFLGRGSLKKGEDKSRMVNQLKYFEMILADTYKAVLLVEGMESKPPSTESPENGDETGKDE
ncbi:hypothetical protein TcG_07271 [Trypanosoma cruzi]|nr:hypothetical protein TcG_07271 [Trypanosoma cruzi]